MFQTLDLALILQLFVMLNPLSSFPVLMTAYKSKLDVRKIAINGAVAAYVIAIVVIFTGPLLFDIYGVSTDSFRVAGGVVLFMLGIDTIRRKTNGNSSQNENEKMGELDSLTSIIATPMLTGPATISFLTLQAIDGGAGTLVINASVAFALVGGLFYLFSLLVPRINPKLIEFSSKILGLFLTAMAVQMIAKGASALLFAAKT
jgi:multiple antibiotic resistance protein